MDRFEIFGHEIDDRVRRGAELVGVHVPEAGRAGPQSAIPPHARSLSRVECTDGRDVGTPQQRDCRGIPNPQEGAMVCRI